MNRLRANMGRGRLAASSGAEAAVLLEPTPAERYLARRIPVTMVIWTISAALAGLAMLLFDLEVRQRAAPMTPIDLPWPLLAFAVAVAELQIVEVHFRRESHSFSLSEFPAVVGIFFLSPAAYLAAVLVGTAGALIFGLRERPMKLAFNLANAMLMATISLAIVHHFARLDSPPHFQEWVAVFGATLTCATLSAILVASVITVSGGAPQFQKLPEMIRFSGLVAIANTSLALLAVSILWLDPALLWLLALPLAAVFLAYRAYVSEHEKHERLEMLYQSSRILQHSPELDSALLALLGHARTMFRAELAEVVLYARDVGTEALRTRSWHDLANESMTPLTIDVADPLHVRIRASTAPFFYAPPPGESAEIRQAMVSPLRGESELIGSFLIANRLTEGTTFSEDDLRLLETLAHQAAAALENGHLEQSLAELSRLKEELRYQAFHDPLTALPNRSLFLEHLTQRLAGDVFGTTSVVLFMDLDDFKIVNDTLGHAVGDRLLAEVGDRLRNVLRADDVVARLGGDEFAVLLDDELDIERSLAVGERIIDALRIPFRIQGHDVEVGASIGIAAASGRSETAGELLRNADVAMYTAKASGKNCLAVFEPTMHASIVARHELSAELSRSLGRGELVVYYQPIIELATSAIIGVEALVRWQHPTRGLIGPDDFIPLAEETGMILPLGAWVLEEACAQAVLWSGHGPIGLGLSVTVNLAAQQLAVPSFVADLQAILERTGLSPGRLVLELTETVMFHDTSTTLARLDEVRALGVRIAIDDFGTGYSSLGYLRRFKVDILKIAREFVGAADNVDDWAFAGAIVALGRTLDLAIIAEGIEEAGQLERLRDLGCAYGQGYLFARPQDAAAVTELLDRAGVPAGVSPVTSLPSPGLGAVRVRTQPPLTSSLTTI